MFQNGWHVTRLGGSVTLDILCTLPVTRPPQRTEALCHQSALKNIARRVGKVSPHRTSRAPPSPELPDKAALSS